MPDSRLNAVVLPAPLGPISACSVRSAMEMSMPWTALMPPKLLTMWRAASTGPSTWDFGRRNSGSGSSFDAARRHRGVFDHLLAERRHQPLGDADQAGRREHDEADEHEAEPEQPVLGVDAEEFAEQDEEQRAQRRPEETAHAADHDHRQQFAGERDRDRIGRGHAVLEQQQDAGEPGDPRRQHEGGELVAVGGIAEETRALLVLADRHQHACRRSNYGSATAGSAPGTRWRRRTSSNWSRIPD